MQRRDYLSTGHLAAPGAFCQSFFVDQNEGRAIRQTTPPFAFFFLVLPYGISSGFVSITRLQICLELSALDPDQPLERVRGLRFGLA
jgi:hypothetical protein